MSLDLNKLENKLDEALSDETSESLNRFLNDKRMSSKQQTAVEWFAEMTSKLGYVSADILEQAKEKEKEQHKVSYWESLKSKFQTFEHYWNGTYGGEQ